jgi:acyl-CoA synthetase (AMP-forming)/AMP-acid ligase II
MSVPFRGWTLDAIVGRNARRFPAKPALIDGAISLNWAELDARVDRVAAALAGAGLKRGDRAALLLPNCREYLELYFGCARAGVIAVPVNYRLTPTETATVLAGAHPALLVAGGDYLGTARAIENDLPELKRWVIGQGSLAGATPYEAALRAAPAQTDTGAGNEDDAFAIFFTSGTTGLPKGAVISHRNLEANAFNQCLADASRTDDVNLIATPLYHMGAVFMAMTYILRGCTQVVLPKFGAAAWLDAVARHRISVGMLVPTMINAVLHAPETAGADLSTLRLVFYGGGPMPPAVLQRAMQRLQCGFTQGYGLTETLEASFLVAADHVLDDDATRRRRLASAGREAEGAEIRIVDETGRELATGETGEILVRSHSVFSGYWNNPEETAAVLRDGWFYTGDLGYLDEDRYLFVVDRKKDMVISGGVNIYTKEIESVLYAHPAVCEAAVIGLPDDAWGEAVTAVVSFLPGHSATAEELIEHCRKHLASYKKPRAVHIFDDLPKSPSGKVLKREIRKCLHLS